MKTSECLTDISTADFSQEAVDHYFRLGLLTVLEEDAGVASMQVNDFGHQMGRMNFSEEDIRTLTYKLYECVEREIERERALETQPPPPAPGTATQDAAAARQSRLARLRPADAEPEPNIHDERGTAEPRPVQRRAALRVLPHRWPPNMKGGGKRKISKRKNKYSKIRRNKTKRR